MKKKELRLAAKQFVEENFNFSQSDRAEVVVLEEEAAFGKAIQTECKKAGARKVILRLARKSDFVAYEENSEEVIEN